MDREEARNPVRRTVRRVCLCWARRGCSIRRARKLSKPSRNATPGAIRVTMITSDHRIMAGAIAKMPDIGDGNTAITGAEMQEMDTATLRERARGVAVFAREPTQAPPRAGRYEPLCQGDPPDVISASFSQGTWVLPRRSAGRSYLLLPLRHRPSPKSYGSAYGKIPAQATSQRSEFSRLQPFLYVQASRFACHAGRSHPLQSPAGPFVTFTSEHVMPRYHRMPRIWQPSETGN